jgi:hypothetical protein
VSARVICEGAHALCHTHGGQRANWVDILEGRAPAPLAKPGSSELIFKSHMQ